MIMETHMSDKDKDFSVIDTSLSIRKLDISAKPIEILNALGVLKYYSKEQLMSINEWFKNQMHGYGLNIGITCQGRGCEINNHCPFSDSGLYPIDNKCPFEQISAIIRLKSLFEEFEIDPTSSTCKASEVRTLIEIVQLEIICDRVNGVLNSQGITSELPISSGRGIVLSSKTEHPLLKVLKDFMEQRQRLLKGLLGTRDSGPTNKNVIIKTITAETKMPAEYSDIDILPKKEDITAQ